MEMEREKNELNVTVKNAVAINVKPVMNASSEDWLQSNFVTEKARWGIWTKGEDCRVSTWFRQFYLSLPTLSTLLKNVNKQYKVCSPQGAEDPAMLQGKQCAHPADSKIYSCLCCSVTQSCPTLCDLMDCSTPGFPVIHYLSMFAQTHVHWVGDAIQPSHPLSSPSPPTFNLSQHQGLFQWVSSLHQVAKGLEFQLQHQSFQWIFRVDFLICIKHGCMNLGKSSYNCTWYKTGPYN